MNELLEVMDAVLAEHGEATGFIGPRREAALDRFADLDVLDLDAVAELN